MSIIGVSKVWTDGVLERHRVHRSSLYKESIVRIRSPHFECEKLPAALEIFTELNMAREWDAVRVELEKMA